MTTVAVIGRGDAERAGGLAAGDDVARVGDDVDVLRVGGSGRGIDQARESGDEVRGDHPVAVGPVRLVPQVEGVGETVAAHAPAARHPWGDGRVRIERRQALAQVAQDALCLEAARFLRVERVRIGAAAAHQDGAPAAPGAASCERVQPAVRARTSAAVIAAVSAASGAPRRAAHERALRLRLICVRSACAAARAAPAKSAPAEA